MTTESDQLPTAPSAALRPNEEKETTTGAVASSPSRGLMFPEEYDPPPKRPKGTTTLAFTFKDGVFVATDHSDASKDASEEYFVENVINLDSHVLVTVSGVGDTRSFLRNMKEQYKHDHEAEERFSALEVSEWAGKYLSSHNDKDPSAKVLIAVWDDEKMRAGVFIMDANGQRSIKKWGATGSGSRVVPCFFKIGQAPFPFDYLVVFVNFFSHPDLLVLLCNSFDKKGYDEAAVYVKWVIDATVSVLAFLKRTGSSDIETCGYISGYYVGANDLKRVFHNEPFTPARVFDNKPSTPAL